MGLGIAWLINITLYGRPHGALLQLIAETAAAGIDCQEPQRSALFQTTRTPDAPSETLHYVLIDAEGHQLGQRGQIPDRPPADPLARPGERWRQDNPLWAHSIWVKVPNVCGRHWSLWAWDPRNETYRRLLLPRQIILVASCSISIILVVLLAFIFIRRKGREARVVLSKLSNGEFGSRLAQKIWEPRLLLIHEFNRMAAAVEDSFGRLHDMEERRARLLSELAHDVRTPLASLRAAAETLSEFHARMSEQQRQTLHQTLMLDLVYFQSLIDDLLILAQIDRLDTTPPQQSSDIKVLLPLIWQRMAEQYPDLRLQLEWPASNPAQMLVPGDEPLLRRLLQNTFDNAFHYAGTFVSCTVHWEMDRLCLKVTNDATPLSAEDLQNWGQKRRQRIITEKTGEPHTSLGLGSSIIVGVSRHLGGQAHIQQSHMGSAPYAEVTVFIELPRSFGAPKNS